MTRALTVLSACLALMAAAACTHGSTTSPTAIVSSSIGAVTARLQPDAVAAAPVTGFACPMRPPFTSTVALVIQAQGTAGLAVDQVTFHFLDGSNVTSHPITFSNGTLVPSASPLTLPFTLAFGCGIGAPRWVVADARIVDARGTQQMVSARAAVR